MDYKNAIDDLKTKLDDNSFVYASFVPSGDNWTGADDKVDLYALVSNLHADGGCIVYGYSARRKEWVANWSARHVIRYLMDTMCMIRTASSIHEISAVLSSRINGDKIEMSVGE